MGVCVCVLGAFNVLVGLRLAPKGYLNVVNVFFTLRFRIECGRNHTTQQSKGLVVGWHFGPLYFGYINLKVFLKLFTFYINLNQV